MLVTTNPHIEVSRSLRRTCIAVSFLAAVSVLACSSESNNGGSGGSTNSGQGGSGQGGANSQGGTPGQGGAANGGAANGGAANGGTANGGAASGGAANGGTANGGSANGGTANGGSSNAGQSNNGGSANQGGTSGNSGGKSSGGGNNGGAAGSSSGGSGGAATGFALTSPNQAEGATFASKYTCSDKGFSGSVMPALNWTEGPANTKSYAITFIDTTLSKQNDPKGYHWVIWNIPASVKSLPEALTDAQAKALPAKENSAFLGPCPNFGSAPPTGTKTDNYEFTLYALATETVDITGSNIVQAAETKLEASNLAKTKLTGKSNAANNK